MTQSAQFYSFLQEMGHIAVPCLLLEKYQALDIPPEELGYLLLAFYQQRRTRGAGLIGQIRSDKAGPDGDTQPGSADPDDDPYPEKRNQGDDPWIGRALDRGWAIWKGEGRERRVDFEPLWRKLYHLWETEQKFQNEDQVANNASGDNFDYSRIVKELDRLRGSLSVTVREKQLIQEFNIKYGWSTDFILNFFRLCGSRNLIQLKNYKPLAERIHHSGIYTLDDLAAFMDEVDWIGRQASEIKKDYLGHYGMVTVMERDYYVKWHVTWRYSHALIVRAARESAGAANATFKYIDTIITRWHDLGADNLEACEEAIRLWNEERKKAAGGGGQPPGRANRRKTEKERGDSLWSGFLEEGDKP